MPKETTDMALRNRAVDDMSRVMALSVQQLNTFQQMADGPLSPNVIKDHFQETAAVLFHAMCGPLYMQFGDLLERIEALESKTESLQAEVNALKAASGIDVSSSEAAI